MIDAALVTPGTVAVLHRGAILAELDEWLGSCRERWPGRLRIVRARGNQIPRQRNMCVEGMYGGWLLFVDADVAPPLDALPRLLATGLDLVGGVYLERVPPFAVAAAAGDPPVKLRLGDLPREAVIPVATCGTGLLLIRRPVFERLDPPWFRCGQIDPEYLLEDSDFCLRAADAGIAAHLHCGVRAGHETQTVVWPGRDGRPWVQWAGSEERSPLDRVLADG